MNKLTLGSLFDGSGGFPLGGLISGIAPVWASEIEPFPIRVTTKRLPLATAPDSKPKTSKQIKKWLADPYSDSAEYKMWGNGVALPCVFFVLSGIVYYSQLPTS